MSTTALRPLKPDVRWLGVRLARVARLRKLTRAVYPRCPETRRACSHATTLRRPNSRGGADWRESRLRCESGPARPLARPTANGRQLTTPHPRIGWLHRGRSHGGASAQRQQQHDHPCAQRVEVAGLAALPQRSRTIPGDHRHASNGRKTRLHRPYEAER